MDDFLVGTLVGVSTLALGFTVARSWYPTNPMLSSVIPQTITTTVIGSKTATVTLSPTTIISATPIATSSSFPSSLKSCFHPESSTLQLLRSLAPLVAITSFVLVVVILCLISRLKNCGCGATAPRPTTDINQTDGPYAAYAKDPNRTTTTTTTNGTTTTTTTTTMNTQVVVPKLSIPKAQSHLPIQVPSPVHIQTPVEQEGPPFQPEDPSPPSQGVPESFAATEQPTREPEPAEEQHPVSTARGRDSCSQIPQPEFGRLFGSERLGSSTAQATRDGHPQRTSGRALERAWAALEDAWRVHCPHPFPFPRPHGVSHSSHCSHPIPYTQSYGLGKLDCPQTMPHQNSCRTSPSPQNMHPTSYPNPCASNAASLAPSLFLPFPYSHLYEPVPRTFADRSTVNGNGNTIHFHGASTIRDATAESIRAAAAERTPETQVPAETARAAAVENSSNDPGSAHFPPPATNTGLSRGAQHLFNTSTTSRSKTDESKMSVSPAESQHGIEEDSPRLHESRSTAEPLERVDEQLQRIGQRRVHQGFVPNEGQRTEHLPNSIITQHVARQQERAEGKCPICLPTESMISHTKVEEPITDTARPPNSTSAVAQSPPKTKETLEAISTPPRSPNPDATKQRAARRIARKKEKAEERTAEAIRRETTGTSLSAPGERNVSAGAAEPGVDSDDEGKEIEEAMNRNGPTAVQQFGSMQLVHPFNAPIDFTSSGTASATTNPFSSRARVQQVEVSEESRSKSSSEIPSAIARSPSSPPRLGPYRVTRSTDEQASKKDNGPEKKEIKKGDEAEKHGPQDSFEETTINQSSARPEISTSPRPHTDPTRHGTHQFPSRRWSETDGEDDDLGDINAKFETLKVSDTQQVPEAAANTEVIAQASAHQDGQEAWADLNHDDNGPSSQKQTENPPVDSTTRPTTERSQPQPQPAQIELATGESSQPRISGRINGTAPAFTLQSRSSDSKATEESGQTRQPATVATSLPTDPPIDPPIPPTPPPIQPGPTTVPGAIAFAPSANTAPEETIGPASAPEIQHLSKSKWAVPGYRPRISPPNRSRAAVDARPKEAPEPVPAGTTRQLGESEQPTNKLPTAKPPRFTTPVAPGTEDYRPKWDTSEPPTKTGSATLDGSGSDNSTSLPTLAGPSLQQPAQSQDTTTSVAHDPPTTIAASPSEPLVPQAPQDGQDATVVAPTGDDAVPIQPIATRAPNPLATAFVPSPRSSINNGNPPLPLSGAAPLSQPPQFPNPIDGQSLDTTSGGDKMEVDQIDPAHLGDLDVNPLLRDAPDDIAMDVDRSPLNAPQGPRFEAAAPSQQFPTFPPVREGLYYPPPSQWMYQPHTPPNPVGLLGQHMPFNSYPGQGFHGPSPLSQGYGFQGQPVQTIPSADGTYLVFADNGQPVPGSHRTGGAPLHAPLGPRSMMQGGINQSGRRQSLGASQSPVSNSPRGPNSSRRGATSGPSRGQGRHNNGRGGYQGRGGASGVPEGIEQSVPHNAPTGPRQARPPNVAGLSQAPTGPRQSQRLKKPPATRPGPPNMDGAEEEEENDDQDFIS
ncbi:hypothetical protein FKW77_003327 [Venturia effusa]|uniref:Uncharacterized protein n=1 Tax=Venturia effusa TaxID=50376 RepID=A0A517LAN7_9PEZI|nr:hypothetical protein FKW77_003327 [Venturia effusa]